ncbi:unnamed protein product, partial [marine sediment metagenome]
GIIGPTMASYIDQWVYIIAIYDGITIKLFINGNLDEYASASGEISTNDEPLTIGWVDYDRYFDGLIDDIRIYDFALEDYEIEWLYSMGLGRNLSLTDFTFEDTFGPSIQDVEISQNYLMLGDLLNITCDVWDASRVLYVTAIIQDSQESIIATLPMVNILGDIYEIDWDSSGVSLGDYYVDIQAFDNSSNQNEAYLNNIKSFTVYDDIGPYITEMSVNYSIIEYGIGQQEIWCTVIDPSGVQWIKAKVKQQSEGFMNELLMDFQGNDRYRCYWTSEQGDPEGFTYVVDFEAMDGENNLGYNQESGPEFLVEDNTIPSLLYVDTVPSNFEYGDLNPITISCDTSDLSYIDKTWATIRLGTTFVESIELIYVGSDRYKGILYITGYSEGTYQIDINATDSSSNNNLATVNNADDFEIRDTTAPEISDVQISDNLLRVGKSLIITCTVSDLSDIFNVTVYIQN